MNCPFHILIYRSRQRSYRELPLRLFEFGTVYRYEKSGVVHGLTRVRGMTQDDAHIFCTKEQMATELARTLDFVLDLLRDYGLDDFYLELSTKPEGKAVGHRRRVGRGHRGAAPGGRGQMDLELVLDEGGGAFYGPKISVQARDAIGRTWQMSTIQLDFQTPQRFDMRVHRRRQRAAPPIMIHRALFGSIERFFGGAASSTTRARSRPGWRRCRRACCRSRRPRPVRAPHRRPAAGRGLPGRDPRRGQRGPRASASGAPSSRRCRTCSWSATTTSSTRPSGSTRAAARPSAAWRSTTSSTAWPPKSSSERLTAPVSDLDHLWAGWRSCVHRGRRRATPTIRRVLLLRGSTPWTTTRRWSSSARPRAHGDERVSLHVGPPAGRAVPPRGHPRRRSTDEPAELMARRRGGDRGRRRRPTRPRRQRRGRTSVGPRARACPVTCTCTCCRAGTATRTS